MVVMSTRLHCVQCDYCGIRCSRKHDLKRHIIACHINGTSVCKVSKCNIRCNSCKEEFHCRNDLILHLVSVHNEKIESKCFSFASSKEFEFWKKDVEAENWCRYIQKTGAKKSKSNEVVTKYFYCHRDGNFRSKAPLPRKRGLKRQGSNKMNNACPSKIICKEFTSGQINVTFVSTHCEHGDNAGGSLNLTEDEEAAITGKIEAGVPFDDILDTIHSSVNDTKSPIALAEKRQLRNIVRDFDLSPWKGHPNDVVSVDFWFAKVSAVDAEDPSLNPVLFYKPRGDKFADERLKSEDVMLVIVNQFQKEMLLKFGNGTICTDTMHGSNENDIYLSTLVVVDEYKIGIPVAFCISNKKTAQMFSVFYEVIKIGFGEFHPNVLMSDDDESVYNAWSAVMGPVPNRSFCAWLVDKSWRTNLRSKIVQPKKRVILYKALRVLLQEANIGKFETLLQNFMQQSMDDPDTRSFAEYFKNQYMNRPKCWAYCYRRSCGINANMQLESIHKIIKYVYLYGKKNRRLDKCLDALTKYSRDCLLRRLRKLDKNYCPALVHNASISHQKAVTNDWNQDIRNADDSFPNVWYVRSSTKEQINYTVELLQNEVKICNSNCLLVCKECNPKICIHTFTCECIDYLFKSDICKHIHSVVLRLRTPAPTQNIFSEKIIFEDIVVLKPIENSSNDYVDDLKIKAEAVLEYLSKPAMSSLTEKEYLELCRAFDRQMNILSIKF